MKNYLDLETSGRQYWKNSAISLAWIITDDHNETIDEFYDECAPDKGHKSWDIDTEVIHGFKEADQRSKKPAIELCNNLLKFLEKNKVYNEVVRYHANAYFDTRMLFAMFFKNLEHNYYSIYKHIQPNNHQNTIELIKHKLPGLPSYRLNELAQTFGISFSHHNALSDTRCLVNICKEIKL